MRIALWPLICLFLAGGVSAGDGNYQNFIIGERAAGMGGAVTASASSVDACYYNPAGLALTPASTISLSASLYGFSRYQVDNGWYPGENVDVDSFVTIPSTFGTILKTNEDLAIAFSAFIPDRSSSNDLEAFIGDNHFFKYNMDDQTLWIGPSLGYRLTPELTCGVSLFGVYRTFSWFRDWLFGDYGSSVSEDIKYSDLGLAAVLGARYALSETWSVGLSVQTPSVHLTGDGKYLAKRVSSAGTLQASYVEDVTTENKIPTRITAGVAYQATKRLGLGLDVTYHFPASFNRFEGYDQFGTFWTYPLRREGTLDVNLGGEYYVMDNYPLRLGFFTDNSSAPETDTQTSYYPAHINKYGITASVGRESEHTTLNVGINYVWGSGDSVGWRTPSELDIVNAQESYLYIFLASSYIF
jgi:long-chain fatty acid transport protein